MINKLILWPLGAIFLTSCALFNPNPNRDHVVSSAPLELKPFTTDYCSEWPDGRLTDRKLWANCCFTHDLNYWIGGTQQERKDSDNELKQCVKISGDSLNSFIMYIGVRMGGFPGNASYAWGYGWNKDRKYFELQSDEASTATNLLETSDHNKNLVEKSLIKSFIETRLRKN